MKDKVSQYDLLEEMIVSLGREGVMKDLQLEKQAREYERRLQDLNHENDRIKEILKESIPRELFDRLHEALMIRVSAVEASIIRTEGKNQLTKYIPWIIAAAALAHDYFKK